MVRWVKETRNFERNSSSTDFKGTFVVVDCVAVAAFGFSDEELIIAKKIASVINDACKEACSKYANNVLEKYKNNDNYDIHPSFGLDD